MRVSEKTTENYEWLGRQAQPGFEPGTSRLPVLRVTTVPLASPTQKSILCKMYLKVIENFKLTVITFV